MEERHHDPYRKHGLENYPVICKAEKSSFELDEKEQTWQEIKDIVKKARISASPGHSRVPYKVCSKCLSSFSNCGSLKDHTGLFSMSRTNYSHQLSDTWRQKYAAGPDYGVVRCHKHLQVHFPSPYFKTARPQSVWSFFKILGLIHQYLSK